MKRIFCVLFTGVIILTSCKEKMAFDSKTGSDPSSDLEYIQNPVEMLNGMVPQTSKAAFSGKGLHRIDPKSALFKIEAADEDNVNIIIEYAWTFYNDEVSMEIVINNVPVVSTYPEFVIESKEALPGVVNYKQIRFTSQVESDFTVEGKMNGGIESFYLNLDSPEVSLEATDFSFDKLEGGGMSIIIDHILYQKDRYVNAMDTDLKVNLGKEFFIDLASGEKPVETVFTLAPGESRDIEYCTDFTFGREDYVFYEGIPSEIELEYNGETKLLNTTEYKSKSRDSGFTRRFTDGFLDIYVYPLHIITFSEEALSE